MATPEQTRNLGLHRVALAKLREQPEVRRACIALVDRWLAMPNLTSSYSWIRQWREMLSEWPQERMETVVLNAVGGQTLRQCSPLGPTLSPRERWAALGRERVLPFQ